MEKPHVDILVKAGESIWNNYTEKFNLLSDKIIESGIEQKLLIELINAYDEYKESL
jgi:hypothetical protein